MLQWGKEKNLSKGHYSNIIKWIEFCNTLILWPGKRNVIHILQSDKAQHQQYHQEYFWSLDAIKISAKHVYHHDGYINYHAWIK